MSLILFYNVLLFYFTLNCTILCVVRHSLIFVNMDDAMTWLFTYETFKGRGCPMMLNSKFSFLVTWSVL